MLVWTASSRCWVRLAAAITAWDSKARSAVSRWRAIAHVSRLMTATTIPSSASEPRIVRLRHAATRS